MTSRICEPQPHYKGQKVVLHHYTLVHEALLHSLCKLCKTKCYFTEICAWRLFCERYIQLPLYKVMLDTIHLEPFLTPEVAA